MTSPVNINLLFKSLYNFATNAQRIGFQIVPSHLLLPPTKGGRGIMESGKRSEEEVAEKIDPQTAKDLLQSGYRYLDVRTVGEYRKGNVKDSINIPYWFFNSKGRELNPQFMELVLKSFSKDDCIVVACASGTRSAGASLDLLNAGFKHVKDMSCGYIGWTKADFIKNKIPSNL